MNIDSFSVPPLKAPLAPTPKLPPQQTLLPQENPFDIQSELIPYQEKEMEPVFKTHERTHGLYIQLVL